MVSISWSCSSMNTACSLLVISPIGNRDDEVVRSGRCDEKGDKLIKSVEADQ